jgi:serine protease DegS
MNMSELMRYVLLPALIGGGVGLAIVAGFLALEAPGSAAVKPGYATAVKRAAPSVVNIYSTKMSRPAICEQPRFREWCNRFAGIGGSRMQSSLGSGVVVGADGFILTNVHVIEGADEILVAFADGRSTAAMLVGRDPETDLAVVRVPFNDLNPIEFGSSDDVEVGDVVLAIGNPFGIGQTVSAGIISAKGRAGISRSPFDDFIQTDAAINPGNSGGALIDTDGRLVGINNMIFTRTGDSAGVGFAIPAQLTRSILTEIIETGRVTRGWLGVFLASGPTSGSTGLQITGIEPGGPAAQAGLIPGDIVLSVNDQPALEARLIGREIAETEPGDRIRLNVQRQGRRFSVVVVAGLRPESP